jgi:spore coat polysaccharide biosynthesis protein SpsF (cytidylyltransferase family)
VTVGILLFSRFDSARLPGKALVDLRGRSLLARCVDRARAIDETLPLVVATSDRPVDDEIERAARAEGVDVYRGAVDDVAGRAVACADAHGMTGFLRFTGDSPFFPRALARRLLARAAEGDDWDLISNARARTYPIGATAEVVRVDALRLACESADADDHEHITRFFYAHPDRFRIVDVAETGDRGAGLRVAVDTPDDLERTRWTLAQLDGPAQTATLDEVARLSRRWLAGER